MKDGIILSSMKGVYLCLKKQNCSGRLLIEEKNKLNEQLKSNHFVVQRLRTYYNEQMIAFLSRKGVFPRYGFPVDTVELAYSATDRQLGGLQLSRDLSMAIAEYAPESQIVANGNLITSRYIKRMPNMLWKIYDYKRCARCGSVSVKIHAEETDDSTLETCPVCGDRLSGKKDAFIIPEFGFIADSGSIRKPGLVKPQRTFNNEIAYIGNNSGGEFFRDKRWKSHSFFAIKPKRRTCYHQQLQFLCL